MKVYETIYVPVTFDCESCVFSRKNKSKIRTPEILKKSKRPKEWKLFIIYYLFIFNIVSFGVLRNSEYVLRICDLFH